MIDYEKSYLHMSDDVNTTIFGCYNRYSNRVAYDLLQQRRYMQNRTINLLELSGPILSVVKKEHYDATKPDTDQRRTDMRVGRAIAAIMGQEYVDARQAAVGELADYFTAQSQYGKFVIDVVSGKDIRYWYNGAHSAPNQSTLASSCMAYTRCQTYFPMYVNNPRQIQLLVALTEDRTKLVGRALVWKTDQGDTFVDIGYGKNSTIMALHDYAKLQDWLTPNTKNYDNRHTVTLDEPRWGRYPYLDSFRYLHYKEGVLFDRFPDEYRYGTDRDWLVNLEYTNGQPDELYDIRNRYRRLEAQQAKALVAA